MRTTVAIDDQLLLTAKERARALGLTLGQYVERALQRAAATDALPTPGPPPLPVFRGGRGTRPGVDIDSNRALAEALDDGLPSDKLR
jgi:hypothetical protein